MSRVSDGGDDHYGFADVTISDGREFLAHNNGPFTLVFWFKAASLGQSNTYIWQTAVDAGGGQIAAIFEFVDDTIEFYCDNFGGSDPRPSSGIVVPDTNWHHIAYRKDNSGASAWDKFLDGSKTSISASINFTTSIGSSSGNEVTWFAANGGSTPVAECAASLAEFGFLWHTALSDSDIANLANGSVSLATLVNSDEPYYPLCGVTSPEPDFTGSFAMSLVSITGVTNDPSGIASPCASGGTVIPILMNQYRQRRN